MPSTALITGATSGIGLALTTLFAKDSYNLVLVARTEDKLHQIAHDLQDAYDIHITVLSADLSQPDAAKRVWEQIESQGLQIDVLVNNAGFGEYGLFAETDSGKEKKMMELNMVCVTQLTKLALQGMHSRGRGKILNIASIAAFQPGPLMAVYYATKAYVLSFSEALAEELRGSGITVTALCPGPTATGFKEGASLDKSELFTNKLMTAEEVAHAGYKGLMHGKVVVVPGLKNKVMTFLVRISPRALVRRGVRYIQRPL